VAFPTFLPPLESILRDLFHRNLEEAILARHHDTNGTEKSSD
jgi:hypothetical protein